MTASRTLHCCAISRHSPRPVASDPVVSRLVRNLAVDGPLALKAIRDAWALAPRLVPRRPVIVDLDATIVLANSENLLAEATRKKTFGLFHPMTAWADHGPDGSGEPLAIVLRPGNAGSNRSPPRSPGCRSSRPDSQPRRPATLKEENQDSWSPAHAARQPGNQARPAQNCPSRCLRPTSITQVEVRPLPPQARLSPRLRRSEA